MDVGQYPITLHSTLSTVNTEFPRPASVAGCTQRRAYNLNMRGKNSSQEVFPGSMSWPAMCINCGPVPEGVRCLLFSQGARSRCRHSPGIQLGIQVVGSNLNFYTHIQTKRTQNSQNLCWALQNKVRESFERTSRVFAMNSLRCDSEWSNSDITHTPVATFHASAITTLQSVGMR